MKRFYLIFLCLLYANAVYSQGVSINEDGTEADPSAVLDVKSESKGVLIPRMTMAQRDAIPSPADGLMIYQSDGTKGFYYWSNSQWNQVGASIPKTSIVLSKTANNTEIEAGGFTYLGKTNLTFTEISGTETFSANSWHDISSVGAPSARNAFPVWTGTEMIVWGGFNGTVVVGDGAKYDPVCDAWSPISSVGVVPKSTNAVVWTGEEMIVWGGRDETVTTFTNSGYAYKPSADTWREISSTNAPSARTGPYNCWTGTELIIWGGLTGAGTISSSYQNNGARYNPSTDTWTSMAASPLSGRYGGADVWTGTEMIIWGGNAAPSFTRKADGARYDPATNTWATMSAGPLNARLDFAYAWTGSEVIIWGGDHSTSSIRRDGAKYNPTTNTWTSTTLSGAPTQRHVPYFVWTGTELIIWGGYTSFQGNLTNTGGRYNPTTNTWTTMTTTNAPSARRSGRFVWTGQVAIMWGGTSNTTTVFSDGKKYAPQEVTVPKANTASTPFYLYEKN